MEDKEIVVIKNAGKRRTGMRAVATRFLSHYEIKFGAEDEDTKKLGG